MKENYQEEKEREKSISVFNNENYRKKKILRSLMN